MNEQWVLLWSQSQNAFHIERLEDTLAKNRVAYREDRRMDYVPLVMGSKEFVSSNADFCHGTLAGRERQGDGV